MTSHTAIPRRPFGLHRRLAAALPGCVMTLSLLGPQAAVSAQPWPLAEAALWPLGSSTCPTSPALLQAAQPGPSQVQRSNWLTPGTKRVPTPADLDTLPRLDGINAIYRAYDFAIPSSRGTVKGLLQGFVVETIGGTCDCYWLVAVDADSAPGQGVRALQINGFDHPSKRLLGGYRTDELPAGVAPSSVARSPADGKVVTFRFEPPLGPGQSSRLMFLDTNYLATQPTGTVQVISTTGVSSKAELADVPSIPAL